MPARIFRRPSAIALRIHFAHPRLTGRASDGVSFHEAGHLDGDIDMVATVAALVREERRRGTPIRAA